MSPSERSRIVGWISWIALFTLAFAQPLGMLIRETWDSELNSYIPLVPFVSAYLLYAQWKRFASPYRSSLAATMVLGTIAAATVGAALRLQGVLSVNDYFGLITFAYVCTIAAGGFLCLGARWMAAVAFPISFLVFMVPLPDAAVYWIERGSVLASADVSAAFFRMTGTPLLRDGEVFTLPGIVLLIGQECSGIRSSWVLFITSLLASHLFLTSPWRRIVLVAFVIPLGIVRNGFRVLVIGLLCVHIGPQMIDSVIHNQGGPLFFALSLAPLGVLLFWLRRQER